MTQVARGVGPGGANRPGIALPIRIHDLLLTMAGRLDDDALADARQMLASAELDRSLEFTAGCIVAGNIALTGDQHRELETLFADTYLDPSVLDRVRVNDRPDIGRHRFAVGAVDGREPDQSVASAVRPVLDVLPDVRSMWCVWRLTPSGPASGPVPHRLVLVGVGPGGFPPATAYRVEHALRRAGIRASVEVLVDGIEPTDYHREAMRNARQVPFDRAAGSPGRMEPAGRPMTFEAPRAEATRVAPANIEAPRTTRSESGYGSRSSLAEERFDAPRAEPLRAAPPHLQAPRAEPARPEPRSEEPRFDPPRAAPPHLDVPRAEPRSEEPRFDAPRAEPLRAAPPHLDVPRAEPARPEPRVEEPRFDPPRAEPLRAAPPRLEPPEPLRAAPPHLEVPRPEPRVEEPAPQAEQGFEPPRAEPLRAAPPHLEVPPSQPMRPAPPQPEPRAATPPPLDAPPVDGPVRKDPPFAVDPLPEPPKIEPPRALIPPAQSEQEQRQELEEPPAELPESALSIETRTDSAPSPKRRAAAQDQPQQQDTPADEQPEQQPPPPSRPRLAPVNGPTSSDRHSAAFVDDILNTQERNLLRELQDELARREQQETQGNQSGSWQIDRSGRHGKPATAGPFDHPNQVTGPMIINGVPPRPDKRGGYSPGA